MLHPINTKPQYHHHHHLLGLLLFPWNLHFILSDFFYPHRPQVLVETDHVNLCQNIRA